MKKTNIIALAFSCTYAIVFSLGIECLLNLLSMSVAISLDGGPVVQQYPGFIPFCVVVGILALIAAVILGMFNLKLSEKFNFSKKIWYVQIISAVVLLIPMIKLWEMLFDFLQKSNKFPSPNRPWKHFQGRFF